MSYLKKILIIEDEKDIREAIAEMLSRNNFMPIEAKGGKEGVELALSKHPDLILLDLLMPEVDGITALKEIRADKWGVDVPVIILTNLSATSEKMVKEMVEYKPAYYLIKSDWKLYDVVKKIKEILKME